MENLKKQSPLIIFGAGGHAVSIANIALSNGYTINYFIDSSKKRTDLLGVKVLGSLSQIKKFNPLKFDFAIAIGDNDRREKFFLKINKLYPNLNFPILIHPSAVVSTFSIIGNGSVIMPNAIIGPNSKIGRFCIINTQSSIDHDSIMENFSSIAPGVVTGGNVQIGARSAISIGAIIKNGLKIGKDCILGANSYLHENLPNNQIAFGSPAKKIRGRERGESYL